MLNTVGVVLKLASSKKECFKSFLKLCNRLTSTKASERVFPCPQSFSMTFQAVWKR